MHILKFSKFYIIYQYVPTCMCLHVCVYLYVSSCMCPLSCNYMYVSTCMCILVCLLVFFYMYVSTWDKYKQSSTLCWIQDRNCCFGIPGQHRKQILVVVLFDLQKKDHNQFSLILLLSVHLSVFDLCMF